ncbi:MAG: hypothetical protein M3R25_08295, partial [Bacteroidota bacterium]|nr:hypothetical protein [Bacteroidota bacterium]
MIAPTDLHIIAFAVPYPPDYGGAIDVWNRVRALHRAGLKIHLHCFVYGSFRPHAAIQDVAAKVTYYPRLSWQAILAPGQPYIVTSRRNPFLLNNLKQDQLPVLFEGIHTTGFIDELKDRKCLLRAHNIEHKYYNDLAADSQRFQYLFFQRESLALHRYECNLASRFDTVFTISPSDQMWYENEKAHAVMIPVFHGLKDLDIKEGRGEYMLYQGDLSIESNQSAVVELLGLLQDNPKYPVIIAGRSGEKAFEEKLTKYPKLRREVDVSEGRMLELVRDAQIIIVHSRHSSGMKVKLFPALYQGRFILANHNS